MSRDLTDGELQDLKFYRQLVDSAEYEAHQKDAPLTAHQKLYHARENLREFTSRLRKEGCRI